MDRNFMAAGDVNADDAIACIWHVVCMLLGKHARAPKSEMNHVIIIACVLPNWKMCSNPFPPVCLPNRCLQ